MLAVLRELRDQRIEPTLLDLAALESGASCLVEDDLEVAGARLSLREARRGWIRRLAPSGWRRDVTASSHAGVVRASWVTMLTGICVSASVGWLTSLVDLWQAENKLVQLRAARLLGIRVPRTCIVHKRDRIPAAFGEQVVVKPLGPGAFTNEDGEAQVVFAREVAVDAPALEHLAAAPFLVQERLEARRHLRVVTVAGRAWVCSLDAPAELDWRASENAHRSFAPSDDDAPVALHALRLAHQLNLGYSSQDWIVTGGGDAIFLDANPAGQWLFLPDSVAGAVTLRLAKWLADARE